METLLKPLETKEIWKRLKQSAKKRNTTIYNKPILYCEFCDRQFKFPGNLLNHINNKH